MAVVKGVKEKIHLPLYDSVTVKPNNTLGNTQSSNILRFFQDVTGKTKLETNMQASSLLPHWNTFEARALRVVISDLAPEFPERISVPLRDLAVVDDEGKPRKDNNQAVKTGFDKVTLRQYVELSRLREHAHGRFLDLDGGQLDRIGLTPTPALPEPTDRVRIDSAALRSLGEALAGNDVQIPPDEQVFPANGCGNVISRFIYNTVTTFYVGEKVMIQVPTWFFPSGAGPYAEDGKVVTHGYPSPQATFRFAEPIFVDTQQNFRVEIEIPEGEVFARLKRLYGPLFIWVVIDGYMTRDVQ